MDITPANVRALRSGFNLMFRSAYDETPVWFTQLTTSVPSSSHMNTYAWANQLPGMREWIGERQVNNFAASTYTIQNKTWEQTFGIFREDFEDDNLGLYGEHSAMMGEAARKHPDELVKGLLQNGHATLCFDGQNFYDTDHPVSMYDVGQGTYSNYSNTAMALTEPNFLSRRTLVQSYKGEKGRNLNVMPDLIQVPPALEVTALEITRAQFKASGATNIIAEYRMANVMVSPDLSGQDTTWYMHVTSKRIKPFVFQTRRALAFQTKSAVTDDVVLEDNMIKFYADARYNVGYSLPFLSYKAVA
jgi:phage major head subunit gpT-like protein